MPAKKEKKTPARKADEKSAQGITVKKTGDFSEWYTQVITKADLMDYAPISGCMIIKPRAYAMWEQFQQWFNKELIPLGVKNCYFPLFIPENLFKKEAKHVEGFAPEVAWVTMGGHTKLKERIAIRPTSETVMYDSYSRWIRSWRDLPLKLNQWCNVVRWEFKHPIPFLRTREFLWQEGHTVHPNRESSVQEAHDILELYARAFEELYAVPVIKGRKSEKEKFAGADFTFSVETFLPNGKAIQGATSHFLGQNFAKAFDIAFFDKDGKKQLPWQNSWGFTTRSIGILVLMHGDDKGLVIPPALAAEQAVIVPIVFEKSREKVITATRELAKALTAHGIRVFNDERDYTPGWKYNEWELKGVPLRIELGPKDLEKEQAVIVRRDTGEKKAVPLAKVPDTAVQLLNLMQKELLAKARKFIESSIVDVKDWKGFVDALEKKKFIRALWCEGEGCEDHIRSKGDGAKCISIPFDQPKKVSGTCVQCGKPAKVQALFARSY